MNKRTILLAGFAALIMLFGAYAFSIFKTTLGDGGKVLNEERIFNKNRSVVDRIQNLIFGAIPGNEINAELIRINGVDTYFYEQAMTSAAISGIATGTVCVFTLPAASTTLIDYSAVLTTNAPTTTSQFAVYNTIGGYATSSFKAIGGISGTIAANGRLNATSTNATSTTGAGIILRGSNGGEDNSFLIFDLQGGSRFTGAGSCRVHLKEY